MIKKVLNELKLKIDITVSIFYMIHCEKHKNIAAIICSRLKQCSFKSSVDLIFMWLIEHSVIKSEYSIIRMTVILISQV